MNRNDCLIIVDLQNDFCPGGALAVKEGDQIVETINRIMPLFPCVVTTQDWHPQDHCSFKGQGGPWPPHCVQNTQGAELHPGLNRKGIHISIRKGQFQDRDAYSGFQETTLKDDLMKRNVQNVFVAGLATDYCVKHTVLDALKSGFHTTVLTDCVKAVNQNPADGGKALDEMKNAGGILTTSGKLK